MGEGDDDGGDNGDQFVRSKLIIVVKKRMEVEPVVAASALPLQMGFIRMIKWRTTLGGKLNHRYGGVAVCR